jgi:hypothetical protein
MLADRTVQAISGADRRLGRSDTLDGALGSITAQQLYTSSTALRLLLIPMGTYNTVAPAGLDKNTDFDASEELLRQTSGVTFTCVGAFSDINMSVLSPDTAGISNVVSVASRAAVSRGGEVYSIRIRLGRKQFDRDRTSCLHRTWQARLTGENKRPDGR